MQFQGQQGEVSGGSKLYKRGKYFTITIKIKSKSNYVSVCKIRVDMDRCMRLWWLAVFPRSIHSYKNIHFSSLFHVHTCTLPVLLLMSSSHFTFRFFYSNGIRNSWDPHFFCRCDCIWNSIINIVWYWISYWCAVIIGRNRQHIVHWAWCIHTTGLSNSID